MGRSIRRSISDQWMSYRSRFMTLFQAATKSRTNFSPPSSLWLTCWRARVAVSVVPAAYVYLVRGDEVLLQRRHHTGYMDGYWVAGAAGHVEPGETAAGCAVRELREELAVLATEGSLLPLTVMQRTDGSDDPQRQRVDWFFTADEWSGTPRIVEPHKYADIGWHSLRALPEPMPSYERVVPAWSGHWRSAHVYRRWVRPLTTGFRSWPAAELLIVWRRCVIGRRSTRPRRPRRRWQWWR